jgi:tryptophan synthase alpha chain
VSFLFGAIPARLGEGYTYTVTRSGVTGVRDKLSGESKRQIELLAALDAPPPVLGFGISTPDHVRAALALGAYGAISGSAVVRRVAAIEDSRRGEGLEELASFIQSMKEATRMA